MRMLRPTRRQVAVGTAAPQPTCEPGARRVGLSAGGRARALGTAGEGEGYGACPRLRAIPVAAVRVRGSTSAICRFRTRALAVARGGWHIGRQYANWQ